MAAGFQRRVADGSPDVHLVRTFHPEGNIDGNPFGLCGQRVPVAPPWDPDDIADNPVCEKCGKLSRGEELEPVIPEDYDPSKDIDTAALFASIGQDEEPVTPAAPAEDDDSDVASAENEGLAPQ